MKIFNLVILIILVSFIATPVFAKKNKQLPPGLQKKAAQGKPLPPRLAKEVSQG